MSEFFQNQLSDKKETRNYLGGGGFVLIAMSKISNERKRTSALVQQSSA